MPCGPMNSLYFSGLDHTPNFSAFSDKAKSEGLAESRGKVGALDKLDFTHRPHPRSRVHIPPQS